MVTVITNSIYDTIGGPNAGNPNTLTVQNTDNSLQTSNSFVNILVGGTTSGNPWTQYTVAETRSWAMGMNNLSLDPQALPQGLWISTAAGDTVNPTTHPVWQMTSAGNRLMPLQCVLSWFVETDLPNFIGSLNHTKAVVYNTSLVDTTGGQYNDATGVFTAPVSGKYLVNASVEIGNLSATNFWQVQLVAFYTAMGPQIRVYDGAIITNLATSRAAGTSAAYISLDVNEILPLSKGDFFYIQVYGNGGTVDDNTLHGSLGGGNPVSVLNVFLLS